MVYMYYRNLQMYITSIKTDSFSSLQGYRVKEVRMVTSEVWIARSE